MYKLKRNQKRKLTRGFTLVELIAVMIILGLLGGVVTLGINAQVQRAKSRTATTQISSLSQAISTFHLECGFYPEGMEALISPPTSGRTCKGYPPGGFLEKKQIPTDPWNNPYNYIKPGTHNTDSYDLWSNGPDAEEGTSDDISNWKTEETEGE